MNLKTKIKNDLWHINYIIPFTAKYLQGGKWNYIKKSLPVAAKLKVVKGDGQRNIASDIKALMSKVDIRADEKSSFFYCIDTQKTVAVRGNILSNFTLDYGRVIHKGFNFVADRAISVGGTYGGMAELTKYAIEILRKRSMEEIKKLNSDQNRERLLMEFADLVDKPAKHFHEGLQRILFFNQFLWQTRHTLNGLGRLDKILGALYENDIESGAMSKDEAYEMICDFLSSLSKWYSFKSSALLGDIGQIIVLGGKEVDGSYFCNDLTYMFIKAQAAMKRPDPKTLLRVSAEMPDELLEAATKALISKTGSPLFSNDDAIIPYLVDFGMSDEDACNYCVSACWEPFIPGKSLDQNNIKTFDFYKPLNDMLNNEKLSEINSFEILLEKYDNYLRNEWQLFLKSLDEFIWARDPFVSMLTDGCNETGKDISEGGAIYSNYGVTSVGMGSVCDTLLNIKKLVYEDKEYTLEELNKSRIDNFKDSPEILAMLKNLPGQYAHDSDEAEELANHIIEISNSEVKTYTNPLGGKVKFGLSSPNYIKNAKKMAADMAGRTAGTPYGTHISSVDAPYTETVKFAGRIKHGKYGFNGNVVDFFVSPGLFENDTKKFTQFLKASIKIGFFQMQMNIMDSATLIDAKSHPEKYPGLIVRVWGFSAYFNDLPETYQDTLIERAKKAEENQRNTA